MVMMMVFIVRMGIPVVIRIDEGFRQAAAGTPTQDAHRDRHAGEHQCRQIDESRESVPEAGHASSLMDAGADCNQRMGLMSRDPPRDWR